MGERRVCLGVIASPHGVRGLVKVKAFTERVEDIGRYGPLGDETGARQFRIEVLGRSGGHILARLEGVLDRDQAAALRGTKLFVPRDALPAPDEEEYYHADLIGLVAVDGDGGALGVVRAVQNHGAGDVLEIRDGEGGDLDLPFTKAVVPEVDLQAGRLTVLVAREDEAEETGQGDSEV